MKGREKVKPGACSSRKAPRGPSPSDGRIAINSTICLLNIYRVLKNYVYDVSGIIEEVITNTFSIWQNFGLCTVLPLDGLTGRWLDVRHNTHRLVLFVLQCLQQVEKVITVSTKTFYDKYNNYVCVYYPSSCHSIPAILKRVYVCTTWRFPFFYYIVHN